MRGRIRVGSGLHVHAREFESARIQAEAGLLAGDEHASVADTVESESHRPVGQEIEEVGQPTAIGPTGLIDRQRDPGFDASPGADGPDVGLQLQ